MIAFFNISFLNSQIEISEISDNEEIELINTGAVTIDVSNFWLCNRPAYSQLSNLTLECGQLNLAPGETVTVSGFAIDNAGDELGVYTNSSFGSPTGLLDYVIFGNRQGASRESVAVAAGLWSLGDRANAIPNNQSLNKDTNLTGSAAFTTGDNTICANTGSNMDQIEISEIAYNGDVELINTGSSTVDVSNFWLCNRPAYTQLSNLTLECGQLNLAPGETVTVSGFTIDNAGDEIGVYTNSSFGSPTGLLDYVIFGNRQGASRESVAVAAGLWSLGDRANAIPNNQSLNKDTNLTGSAAYTTGNNTICGNTGSNMDQIEISEIAYNGDVELINTGSSTVDISNFWLCNRPSYSQLSNLTLECGQLNLAPGETVTVSGFAIDNAGDELGVYTNSSFGSPTGLLDYVIFGNRQGASRESVAVAAGLWSLGDRANAIPNNQSLNKDTNLTGLAAFTTGDNTICGNTGGGNGNCTVDGGSISLPGNQDRTVICVDGNPDPLNVNFDSTPTASFTGYIITDNANNILATPAAQPFDLDGAGVGICFIYSIAYESGFSGAQVGNNISDLQGCFDLSNAITVYRESPDGGQVSLQNGGTSFAQCAGQISFNVTHTNTAPNLSYWYIITDNNNNILDWVNSANSNFIDLSSVPAGVCRVWGWSYRGLGDPIIGQPISSLNDDDCEAISTNFITVYREIPDGGKVYLANGNTNYVGTVGNIVIDVMHATTAPNLSYWYIVTDDNNRILDWVNSANSNTIDLSNAPAGVCRVWGWNYRGLGDPIIGDPLSTLMDDFCEDISDNFITVTRNPVIGNPCNVDGGEITFENGQTNTSICVDGNPDPLNVVFSSPAIGSSRGYIITDDENNIIAIPPSGPFDLDGAGEGTCLIWSVAYSAQFSGAAIGSNLSELTGCFDLSDPLTVYREAPEAGRVSLLDGSTNFAQCAGQIRFDVTRTNAAQFLSYWYIITDDNNIILDWVNSANSNTIDLSNAPAGTCRIWGWSYRGLGDPIRGQSISTLDDDDCEDISDNYITVYREVPDGGTVSLLNGLTSYSGVTGNIVFDVQHTTTAPFLSYWYIITDDNNRIIDWVNSANSNTINLNDAPTGVCRIWGWNYRGLGDPIIGQSITTLDDDFCEDISSNYIEVTRLDPTCNVSAGRIALPNGKTSLQICVDNVSDYIRFSPQYVRGNYRLVITDDNNDIISLPSSNTINANGMSAGEYRVYILAYSYVTGVQIGNNLSQIDGCFDLSNAFILDRIICNTACETPSNFNVRKLTSNKVFVSWDPSYDASGYEFIIGFAGSSSRFTIPIRGNSLILSSSSTRPILIKVRAICGSNSYSDFTDYLLIQLRGHKSLSDSAITGKQFGEFTISESSLNVYPNPAVEFINMDFEGTSEQNRMQIIDAVGRVVLDKTIGSRLTKERISVNGLEQGIYQVIITSDGELVDKTRFIKV